MAALASEFPPEFMKRVNNSDKKKKDGSGRHQSGVSAVTLGHLNEQCAHEELPCNEALHADLRAAFRQVYSIHAPTLRPRLGLFVFSKQVAYEGEHRVTGLRQHGSRQILARVLARPLLDEAAWRKWCRCDQSGSFVQKAVLPERAAHRLNCVLGLPSLPLIRVSLWLSFCLSSWTSHVLRFFMWVLLCAASWGFHNRSSFVVFLCTWGYEVALFRVLD